MTNLSNVSPALPLGGRRSGYASPLPAPALKKPAAPTAPPPPGKPAQVVIPDDNSDDPDVTTVLTGDATADEITAAAARFRRAAQLAAGRAERDQAEADQVLEKARAEVARIIGEAESATRPLTQAAALAGQAAAALSERSRLLREAAGRAVTAEQAEVAVQALEDEREQLAGQDAALGKRRSTLTAERRDLERQLAEARDAGDVDAMTAARTRAESIRELEEALRAQQAPLQQRLAEIGTGDENFSTHPLLRSLPPLAEARRQAGMRRSDASRALNKAFPDRPEAVAAREWQRRQVLSGMAAEQGPAERAQQAPRTRQSVYLG